MRRVAVVIAVVCAAVAVAAQPVGAKAPSPSNPAGSGAAPAGQPICTISDTRVLGLSGLVATDNGYVAINDSNDEPSAMKIFRLDNSCKVTGTTSYPTNALDPEDLAMAPDGTLWVADIGDNNPSKRKTVGFWKLAPNAKSPVPYRVTYPDGPRDAEAIVIGTDGLPIIFTKELLKPVGIYVPTAALVANSQTGVPLRRAGEWKIPNTETPNPLGAAGRSLVTGAALSPDGKKVVLRTYSDAFEWDVPDGDIVKAVTTGKPRITALPNEAQGEAITYSRDGKTFVTVSDLEGAKNATPLLRYTPATPVASAPPKQTNSAGKGGATASSLTLNQIMYLVAGVGVLGLLLVVVGVFGIRRSRRSRRNAAAGNRAGFDGPPPTGRTSVPQGARGDYRDDDYGLVDASPPARRGGGYQPAGERTGNVYGGGRRDAAPEPEWDGDPYQDGPYRDDQRYGRR